jgi:hypothetical protein
MDSNDAFMVLCMADKVHVVDLSRPFEPLYSIDSNWGIPRDVSVFSSGMYDTFAVASDGGHVALHDVRGRGAYPSPCHRVPSAPPKPLLLPTQPQQMAVDSTPSGMAAPSEHVFPVHGITHHPTGSFVSAGGDGALTFWSTIGQVLKYLPSDALGGTPAAKVAQNPVIATPLVTVSYSRSGNLVAYASSADWTRGPASGSGPNVPVRIIVRTVANDGKMAS